MGHTLLVLAANNLHEMKVNGINDRARLSFL